MIKFSVTNTDSHGAVSSVGCNVQVKNKNQVEQECQGEASPNVSQISEHLCSLRKVSIPLCEKFAGLKRRFSGSMVVEVIKAGSMRTEPIP